MGHNRLTDADPSKSYPEFLKKAYAGKKVQQTETKPELIHAGTAEGKKRLQQLANDTSVTQIIDNYGEQYAELLLSKNAHLYRANYDVQVASVSELLTKHYGEKQAWELGSWVFFPWSGQLVHILGQEDFEDLRTIRNRDLITKDEQAILFDFRAACFGMSVGSAGALALAITGISRHIKLIDGAVISGSNLNRILTGVSSVGKHKAQVIAEKIYEMNPYSEVATYDKVNQANVEDILNDEPKTDVVIDEIDDIEMKVGLRLAARRRKIPVLMATEIGDTIILDVERFDLEPKRPIFHDLVPGIETLIDNPPENYREWTKHAVRIIDPRNMSHKMQESLLKIGTTVVTHPQLGSTVMATGGVLAFAAKNIALGNPIKSGRYVISMERQMLADHQTRAYKRKHKQHTKVIHKAINSM